MPVRDAKRAGFHINGEKRDCVSSQNGEVILLGFANVVAILADGWLACGQAELKAGCSGMASEV